VSGAQMIQLGEAGLVLTGGIESMSQAPHVIRGLRDGLKLGQGKLEDSLWEALLDPYCGCTMALTAENCAAKYEIPRDAQDCYALRSQQLADAAWKAGRFVEEIVPVEIKTRKGVQVVDRDDHMRPNPATGLRRENCGTSAWPEKFQPPMTMGAASAATKVAPSTGRMIHNARAPAAVSAGQITPSSPPR